MSEFILPLVALVTPSLPPSRLVLPPMGTEERAELSKLASVYKLRCRYGKALTLAPSTLIKAR